MQFQSEYKHASHCFQWLSRFTRPKLLHITIDNTPIHHIISCEFPILKLAHIFGVVQLTRKMVTLLLFKQ